MIRESARKSSFLFKPVDNGSGSMVEVGSFDREGLQVMKRQYPLRGDEGGFYHRGSSKLLSFITQAMETSGGDPRNGFLVVHPVNPQAPGSILREENYREFSRLENTHSRPDGNSVGATGRSPLPYQVPRIDKIDP